MRYVVQVEIDRRVLYGPFDTLNEAVAVAKRFQDEFVSDVLDSTMFTTVKKLLDSPWTTLPFVDHNQTTLYDHIDDIANTMT